MVREVLYKIFAGVCQPKTVDYELLAEICKPVDGKYDKTTIDMYLTRMASIAYNASLNLQNNGYVRTKFSSELVGIFIKGVKVDPNDELPALSKVYLENETREQVEVLKHFAFRSLIVSPRLNIVAKRGYEIVEKIFDTLVMEDDGIGLLPDDYKYLVQRINVKEKHRVICDFIAGMTDRYAIEFYGRLTSENPETIFKPF